MIVKIGLLRKASRKFLRKAFHTMVFDLLLP